MRVLYLHGFASSARSSKAAFFEAKLAARGVRLDTPDLNEPDFSTLTISRMVAQVLAALDAGDAPAAVIGSSLGGFVAVQAALQRPAKISRLVLLAPALDVGGSRMRDLAGSGFDGWEASNRLDVFHYGYGRTVPVHYDLYADATRYAALDAGLTLPIQIFQGRRDAAVDPATVERWARGRSNVELHMLDDDHQLHASLEGIWSEMERFLGLLEPSAGLT